MIRKKTIDKGSVTLRNKPLVAVFRDLGSLDGAGIHHGRRCRCFERDDMVSQYTVASVRTAVPSSSEQVRPHRHSACKFHNVPSFGQWYHLVGTRVERDASRRSFSLTSREGKNVLRISNTRVNHISQFFFFVFVHRALVEHAIEPILFAQLAV